MSLIKAINQLNYTEFAHRSTSRSLGDSRVTTASVDAKAKWTAASETSVFWGLKVMRRFELIFHKLNMNTFVEMPGSVVKCRAFRLEWQAAILVSYLALFRSHICSFSRSPTAVHTNTDTQHALRVTVAVLAKHIPISILGLCARVSLRDLDIVFGGDQWQMHYVKLLCVTIRKWSDERTASRVTGS